MVALLRFEDEESRRNILRSSLNVEASINILLNHSLNYLFQNRPYNIRLLNQWGIVFKLYSE